MFFWWPLNHQKSMSVEQKLSWTLQPDALPPWYNNSLSGSTGVVALDNLPWFTSLWHNCLIYLSLFVLWFSVCPPSWLYSIFVDFLSFLFSRVCDLFFFVCTSCLAVYDMFVLLTLRLLWLVFSIIVKLCDTFCSQYWWYTCLQVRKLECWWF